MFRLPRNAIAPLDVNSPVVIGGVGGSGTRLVADILGDLGVYLGLARSSTRDNAVFAALFFRAPEFFDASDPVRIAEIERRLKLFDSVMFNCFRSPAAMLMSRCACISFVYRHCKFWARPTTAQQAFFATLIGRKAWAARAPSNYLDWGFKEPISHLLLPSLTAHYPGLRFVLVLRNGIDVACRSNQAQARIWGPVFGLSPTTPGDRLKYWLRANHFSLANGERLLGQRLHVLCYDTLCERPHDTIMALAAFIGATQSAQGLAEIVQRVERRKPNAPHAVGTFDGRDVEAADALLSTYSS